MQVGAHPVYLSHFPRVGAALLHAFLLFSALWWFVRVGWKQEQELLKSEDERTQQCARRTVHFALCLVAAFVLLAGWYALSSWAVHFYTRYLSPLALPSSVALAFLLHRFVATHARGVAVLCGALCAVLLLAVTMIHTGKGFRGNVNYSEQYRLTREHVPASEAVAAGQSGTLIYFRERVINLDGKVNAQALRYQGEIARYLEQLDVRWLCDFPGYAKEYLGERPEEQGWQFVAQRGQFVLYYKGEPNPPIPF